MDIKLKKLIRKWYYKAGAFILIIIMAVAFIVSGLKIVINLESNDRDFSVLGAENYGESELYYREISRVSDNITTLGYAYRSIENIEKGNTVSQNEIYQNLYRLWQNREFDNIQIVSEVQTQDFENRDFYISDDIDLLNENTEFLANREFMQFIKDNPKLLSKMREKIIKEDLNRFSKVQNFLDSEKGFDYYAKIGGNVFTNLKFNNQNGAAGYLEKLPYYLKMNPKQKNFQYYGKSNQPYSTDEHSYHSEHLEKIDKDDYLVVGVNTDYLKQQETNWSESRHLVIRNLMIVIISLLLSVPLFIYLCLVTGKRPEDDEVHICLIDRMFTEFHIIIETIILAANLTFFEKSLFISINQAWTMLPFILILLCVSLAISMVLVLSVIRSIKARRFLYSFLTFRIIKIIWTAFFGFIKKTVKGILDMLTGGNLMQKAVIFSILVPLLSAIWFATPFIIGLLLYFSYKIVTRFNAVADGVKKVKDGDVNFKIQIDGKGEIADLAEDINSLSTGLGGAISSEIRSERLKAELISNVSHDIKTPLTSVITYVDLLKSEKIDNEKAKEYIDIIERKANRLKVLTTDLFEAAKASSGSMSVTLEKLDVCALVRQGLGEMSDKISDANLDFRVSMADAPLYILADGRLMWRVLENLISNAVKYALPGSRVYIDVKTVGDYILLTMKNMSAYELNIPAEELMERFKRGDESRSSDGSGLGLSIANSLTTLQKGIFKIEVDGDLFKATVAMPKYH